MYVFSYGLGALYPDYNRLWLSVYPSWEGVVQEVLVRRVAVNAADRVRKKGVDVTAARSQIWTTSDDAIKRTFDSWIFLKPLTFFYFSSQRSTGKIISLYVVDYWWIFLITRTARDHGLCRHFYAALCFYEECDTEWIENYIPMILSL